MSFGTLPTSKIIWKAELVSKILIGTLTLHALLILPNAMCGL